MLHVELLAVGTRSPDWVEAAVADYTRRLKQCRFTIREIRAADRRKPRSIDDYKAEEADLLLAAVRKDALVIAMDRSGRNFSTEQLADKFRQWQLETSTIQIMIGGPDGLHQRSLAAARQCWSISNLTFPHQLVRVILAEQVYRAFSILANHPYHK